MTKQEIIEHITMRDFDLAIDGMKSLLSSTNDVILVAARWKGLERDIRNGLVAPDYADRVKAQISAALLDLTQKIPDGAAAKGSGGGASAGGGKPKVFISYNHNDAGPAALVVQKLRESNVEVTIDSEAIDSGQDIDAFILECVRKTDFTISLVSTNSLLSGWVAKETLLTMFAEKLGDGSNFKFIACALDSAFFKDDFAIIAGMKLTEDIKTLDENIDKLNGLNMKTTHLDKKKARLQDLKHSLPDILDRLLVSKTEDLSGAKFDSGMANVVRKVLK